MYIILIGVFIFLSVIGAYMIASEYRDWNKGFSSATGGRWELFSTDSSGARGYKDSKDNVVWISWFYTL